MGWSRESCKGRVPGPLVAVLSATLLLGACDTAIQPQSVVTVERAGTPLATVQMTNPPGAVFVGKTFTREEVYPVARMIWGNESDAEEFMDFLFEGERGALLDLDLELFQMLALMSDDLAIRIGALHGLAPDESLEWAQGLLAEHGPPSTWEIKLVVEDEEGGEGYPPGD